ncbi:MAG: hypothetical protein WC889_16560, partial [Myxococcota bacterium]
MKALYPIFAAAFLLVPCLVTGCSAGETAADGGTPDAAIDAGAELHGARALFVLDPAKRELPVPFDFFTREDPTTSTGLRVDLGDMNNLPFDCGLTFLGEKYVKAIAYNDGWSSIAPIIFSVKVRIDETLLDRADGFTGPDSPVMLFAEPSGSGAVTRVALFVSFSDSTFTDGRRARYVSVRPKTPLAPATRYIMAVTTSLKTTNGLSIIADADFAAVRDGTGSGADYGKARALIAPAIDVLTSPAVGLPRETISLVSVFTTNSVIEDFASIVARMDSGTIAAPVMSKTFYVDAPSYPGSASARVTGSFNSPRFTNPDGVFVTAPDGSPELQKDDDLEFVLLMPSTGKPPFSVCIYQ